MKTIYTASKEETLGLGAKLAASFVPGDVVLLRGDLGAGKTAFVSGVGAGLNCGEDVISPTFNILKCYFHGTLPMYHIDAYRLDGQNIELGLDECIEGDGVCLIEWPDFIAPLLPDDYLAVSIFHDGEKRRFEFEGHGPRGLALEERVG